jgi:HK97 gp10 family phage protein
LSNRSVTVAIMKLKTLTEKVKGLPPKIQKTIGNRALRVGAKIIAREAKNLAPVGETGALSRGIKVRAVTSLGKGFRGRVGVVVTLTNKTQGTDTFYAPFLEFGTKLENGLYRIKPRRFLKKAARNKAKEAQAASIAVLESEIHKHFSK